MPKRKATDLDQNPKKQKVRKNRISNEIFTKVEKLIVKGEAPDKPKTSFELFVQVKSENEEKNFILC